MHDGVAAKIREAGGEIYAITSEPQRNADMAQKDWELDFECIGDPHHEISGECHERGWLDLFVNEKTDGMQAVADWVSHPKGNFQPGVVAFRANGRVLYRWRSRPNRKNIGGAIARPTAQHVWASIDRALAEPADAPDLRPDAAPEMDTPEVSWLVFVAMLLANGWFLRPRVFDQRSSGRSARQRMTFAMLRIPVFLALWIAAFVVLPPLRVAVALAGWVALVWPPIQKLSEHFQNVGPEPS